MASGVIEALIPSKSCSRGATWPPLLLRRILIRSNDQMLQTEHAPRVPPRRLLPDLVQTLGELSFRARVVQLDQILHILAEHVRAADLSPGTGQLLERALVRPRPNVRSVHGALPRRRPLDCARLDLPRLQARTGERGEFCGE